MSAITINYIWKYRNKKRIGQKRLAHLLGHYDSALISKWENGKVVPTTQNLFKLSYILQVPAETIFPGLYNKCSEEVEERQVPFLKEEAKVEENQLVV